MQSADSPTVRRTLAMTFALLVALTAGFPSTAAAQYGGVSGLFVATSPANPGVADFTGLGCGGDVEVVLYLPGVQPTASDPSASQAVPGRILAVTTSQTSTDPVQNGIFAFPGVTLPTDLEPGTYAVHARCGGVDLRALVQINGDGTISVDTDPLEPAINPLPEALPFTGRDANRQVALAAGLVAVGVSLAASGRRSRRAVAR